MPSIQVIDSDDKPIENAEVFVKWQGGGISTVRTNSLGVADLRSSGGTVEEIRVNGKSVSGKVRLETDAFYTVRGSRF